MSRARAAAVRHSNAHVCESTLIRYTRRLLREKQQRQQAAAAAAAAVAAADCDCS